MTVMVGELRSLLYQLSCLNTVRIISDDDNAKTLLGSSGSSSSLQLALVSQSQDQSQPISIDLTKALRSKSVDIVLAFDKHDARLAASVRTDTFGLYTAPSINLFEKTSDRVAV